MERKIRKYTKKKQMKVIVANPPTKEQAKKMINKINEILDL